jgi:hypothetical protein
LYGVKVGHVGDEIDDGLEFGIGVVGFHLELLWDERK